MGEGGMTLLLTPLCPLLTRTHMHSCARLSRSKTVLPVVSCVMWMCSIVVSVRIWFRCLERCFEGNNVPSLFLCFMWYHLPVRYSIFTDIIETTGLNVDWQGFAGIGRNCHQAFPSVCSYVFNVCPIGPQWQPVNCFPSLWSLFFFVSWVWHGADFVY